MDIKQKIRHFIINTVGSLNFVRLIEWREMLRLLKPQSGENCLDVACGGGGLSLIVARRGCQVHGIDIGADPVKKASLLGQRQTCSFLVADAEKLPYKDGSFDKVVCSSSVEHFSNDSKALMEMSRVLKKNGVAVLTADSLSYPMKDSLKEKHRKQYYVVSYYHLDEMSEKLKQSGFRVLSSKYLFNSPLTSLFYNLHIILYGKYYRQLALLLLGDLLVPLLIACDKLFGRKNCGYTLLVKAEKM